MNKALSVRAAGYFDEQLHDLNKHLADGWEIIHIAQMSDGAIFILRKPFEVK